MERNFFKTIDVRILGEVDVLSVIKILPTLKNEWDKEEDYKLNRNKTKLLNQVQHINFRWSDKKKEPVEYKVLPLWETYKNILLPVLKKAVEPIGYKNGFFPRVMFAKMLPGSNIPEHIDGSGSSGWIAHKIHIPIITNSKAIFSVKGKVYYFEKAKVYEVNNGAMHGTENAGETARIHLIFEYLDADINEVPFIDVQNL
jgi:hypothetical protein